MGCHGVRRRCRLSLQAVQTIDAWHDHRYYKGEAFYQAIARHEHYLAAQTGIRPKMKVLDVGCGVGGPAREIARFTDAEVVGCNSESNIGLETVAPHTC